jgi:hypothetical protein
MPARVRHLTPMSRGELNAEIGCYNTVNRGDESLQAEFNF